MRRRLTMVAIIIACLCGLMLAKPPPTPQDWLDAVAANEQALALSIAAQLLDGEEIPGANPLYVGVAEQNDFDTASFDGPFNGEDFRLWRTAWFFKQQASSLAQNATAQQLLDHVNTRMTDAEDPIEDDWPLALWKRGYGLCDRQSWVLSELAWQAGWETQVVYLYDEKHTTSPHTICELRKSDTVALVDPLSAKLLPKSVDAVVHDDKLLQELWPDKPVWRDSLQYSMFWTPSFPSDYAPRNALLYNKLSAALGDDCPRFGIDPKQRADDYRKLRLAEHPDLKFTMGLWTYPFRLHELRE
jgi:hypothetical protein